MDQRRERPGRYPLVASWLVLVLTVGAAAASGHDQFSTGRRPDRSGQPSESATDYALVLLADGGIDQATRVREAVTAVGGSVSLVVSPHAMVGWVPRSRARELIGRHGIATIAYEPVNPATVRYRDDRTHAAIAFFNSMTGTSGRAGRAAATVGAQPSRPDVFEPPAISYRDYVQNLDERSGMSPAPDASRSTSDELLASVGNSDAMVGTVAVTLFFVESNGAIDPNQFSWTPQHQNDIVGETLTGLSFWSSQARSRGRTVTFLLDWHDATSPAMAQPYEPVLHSAADDRLWIAAIMGNLGYVAGNHFARVAAFNTVRRAERETDWAYSIFVAYNPPSATAPSTFTDGFFAYAYLGGPYTQLLYKNGRWEPDQFGVIAAHETGHIFWACDEYFIYGYGGCSGCGVCAFDGPRPGTLNGNCDACNADAVSCMMRFNDEILCDFTAAQIGWGNGPPCTGDAECDDGLWCNGSEVCSAEHCYPGVAIDCTFFGDECTPSVCDEANDRCTPDLDVGPCEKRVSGRSVLLRDVTDDPSERRVVVVSRDPDITPAIAGGPNDPRFVGALLDIANPTTGERDVLPLPFARWRLRSSGWRYADPGRVNGPCTSALLKHGRLKVQCDGAAIAFTLDERVQQTMDVTLRMGDLMHCMEFGGTVTRDVSATGREAGVFKATGSASPAGCPN